MYKVSLFSASYPILVTSNLFDNSPLLTMATPSALVGTGSFLGCCISALGAVAILTFFRVPDTSFYSISHYVNSSITISKSLHQAFPMEITMWFLSFWLKLISSCYILDNFLYIVNNFFSHELCLICFSSTRFNLFVEFKFQGQYFPLLKLHIILLHMSL